jgi:hypothetical protein
MLNNDAVLSNILMTNEAYFLWSGYVMVKVKQSCNRPGVTQRVSGGLRSQIS